MVGGFDVTQAGKMTKDGAGISETSRPRRRSLPWTVIFAVIHNQRHDLSTLADNNGIEFLSNKGNKRERKRTEHSQSMLGQTCSDLVRLVQASLCNLKRSTPRTVSSLMMSPDKGSPFNSRWEVGVGWQTWKKQTNLIITSTFPFLSHDRLK